MEREPISLAGKQAGNVTEPRFLKGFFLGCCALVIWGVISKGVHFLLTDLNVIGWQYILLGIGLCVLLAWSVERLYTLLRWEHKNHYRLAFWSAALTPLLGAMLIFVYSFRVVDIATHFNLFFIKLGIVVLASHLGSFLGCIVATTASVGLWENNSPPPQQIDQAVFQTHQERLGMLPSVPFWKRFLDISLAYFGLLFSLPVWLIGIFLIWYEDPGPLFFVKNSVGRGGKNFHQLKLRTMICGAEDQTGPVISQRDDQRILLIGHIFRKTALDELPQLLNIIRGEMSFVGPRPQRTVLVYQYLQKIPEYADRHKVLPGLAGLAQVAGDYYLTPRQKLRLDRLYIHYMSLGFDLKLLLLAFLIAFWFRWQKGWDGRLPRKLIRFGSKV
jgi:lipopolysaccharide/colanic/teichoic acid biosynthesis glycosyltransferase